RRRRCRTGPPLLPVLLGQGVDVATRPPTGRPLRPRAAPHVAALMARSRRARPRPGCVSRSVRYGRDRGLPARANDATWRTTRVPFGTGTTEDEGRQHIDWQEAVCFTLQLPCEERARYCREAAPAQRPNSGKPDDGGERQVRS